MEPWMKNHIESDVQTAIQTQTIQTALERNTAALSDAAFQSFLSNAPIPRVYLIQSAAQAVAAVTTTPIAYNQAGRVYDPYQMLSTGSTTTIIIPVAGFYTFVATVGYSVAGIYTGRFMTFTTGVSKRLGSGVTIMQYFAGDGAGESANNGNMSAVLLAPFDAGDTFLVSCSHNGGAGINTVAGLTTLAGVWNSPYSQYTGGN